jgi:hypothetical protein
MRIICKTISGLGKRLLSKCTVIYRVTIWPFLKQFASHKFIWIFGHFRMANLAFFILGPGNPGNLVILNRKFRAKVSFALLIVAVARVTGPITTSKNEQDLTSTN